MSVRKQKNSKDSPSLFDLPGFFETADDLVETEIKNLPVFQKGRLYRLDVADLLPDPSQPRQTIDQDSLEDLSLSIRKHGVLEPILFRQDENGQLLVVAGSRRLEATRKARLTKIPAIVAEGDSAELALVENLIRQDLTTVEESEAIEALKSRHNYTLAELSAILGRSVTTMSEIISLTRLPQSIRNECRSDHNIARSILVEIAKLPDEQSMLNLFDRYKKDGLTRSDLRKGKLSPQKKSGGYTRLFRSFSRQVSKINILTLEDSERIKIKKELESLKQIIEDNLAKIG